MIKIRLLACVALAGLLSCKKKDPGPQPDPIPPQLYSYTISPSTTHPVISQFNNQHYVYLDTRVALKQKLFVFLPGTSGSPFFYSTILKASAGMGYHSIGLMYPNNSDLYTVSGFSLNNQNFGKGRQEIFDGSDQIAGVNVDMDNCIKTRLIKVLQYLHQQYPSQNWNQYLNNGDVFWNKVIIAGHSQGGGHAFYIAKKVGVDRTISFASIDWNSLLNQSADWVSQPGATPVSKFYSFIHTGDEIFAYANVTAQLSLMGLQGPASNIDSSTPPFGNSHNLITTATPALNVLAPNHSITCLDQYIPKNANGNITDSYKAAWEYLLDK